MMKKGRWAFLGLLIALMVMPGEAFGTKVLKVVVDPPNWWVGMPGNTVELLVEHRFGDIQKVTLEEAQGVRIFKDEPAQNPHYHYVTLVIEPQAPAQTLQLNVYDTKSKRPTLVPYVLEARDPSRRSHMGLDSRDLIYLVTPDRFANGNPSNDRIRGLAEQSLDRSQGYERHGGDLEGLTAHLDFIASLGATAVWTMPILENDMPRASYHGYAITNHYRVDPRFGGFSAYADYADALHAKGMKLVMDMVPNHIGTAHRFYQNPPDSNWINAWPGQPETDKNGEVGEPLITNHRYATMYDPYAAPSDKAQFTDGWFVSSMVDVNQRDRHCAQYLVQNAIWWIESIGVDAFRVDTWIYPDQSFLNQWSTAIHAVYPDFFIFSESWVHNEHSQQYFLDQHPTLDGAADFMMYQAWKEALEKPTSWNGGLNHFYMKLAADYLYRAPENFVVFLDNHDEGRFFAKVKEDKDLYKMGLAMLYTMRGIPCLFYGTEVLMRAENDHGAMRQDMFGGWEGDTKSAFTGENLTGDEAEALAFVRDLADLRTAHPVIGTGSLRQWAPYNDVYAYAWYNEEELVLVLVNRSEMLQKFAAKRLHPLVADYGQPEILLETKPAHVESKGGGPADWTEGVQGYPIAPNGLTMYRFPGK
ncbi:MAG: alpha-amylase family glycosyl hydrolase [Schleiferiaceae bacterium]